MIERSVFNNAKRLIGRAKSALVVCHIDPDADTIGSMIATALLLKSLKLKRIVMFSSDIVPKTFNFLPHASKIVNHLAPAERFDICITVDAADIRRVGSVIDPKKISGAIINIDHHPDNSRYGDVNILANVSSTAELIYDLARKLKVKITRDMAECLYTAIITDTGNFRYENTSAATFDTARELLKCGISPNRIATKIYDLRSLAGLKVLAYALEVAEVSPDGLISWTTVTEAMIERADAHGEELTSIVDHLRSIKGVEVALLFREQKDQIKVNLRSKEYVNVQKIASVFGGGGHKRASGIASKGRLEDVREKVISEVKKALEG